MLVVFEVLHGPEQFFGVLALFKHIAEDDHHRTFVDGIGDLVQRFGGRSGLVANRVVDDLVEIGQEQAIMGRAALAAGMDMHILIEDAQPEGVALPL